MLTVKPVCNGTVSSPFWFHLLLWMPTKMGRSRNNARYVEWMYNQASYYPSFSHSFLSLPHLSYPLVVLQHPQNTRSCMWDVILPYCWQPHSFLNTWLSWQSQPRNIGSRLSADIALARACWVCFKFHSTVQPLLSNKHPLNAKVWVRQVRSC